MSEHNVYIQQLSAKLTRKNATFSIYKDGRKLGNITITKEAVEWFPISSRQPYSMSWDQFDKMISDWRKTE